MAARAVSIDVKQGMRFSAAARRMWNPSRSEPVMRFSDVFSTQRTVPSSITSTTFGCVPLSTFVTTVEGMPSASSIAPVPSVA